MEILTNLSVESTVIGILIGLVVSWLFAGISSFFIGGKIIGGSLAFFIGGMFGIVSGVPVMIIGTIIIYYLN